MYWTHYMNKFALIGLLTLLSFSSFSYSKTLDAIALVVEGEAITTAEVKAVQKKMNIPKAKAETLLIQDRLQKSAMKDIFINEDSIDEKVTFIAKQNGLSVKKMQEILQQQGTSWSQYRSNMRDALKKEQFFQKKVMPSIPQPSQEELKLFYRNNKTKFILPKTIELIEYSAPTLTELKTFLQTRNPKNVTSKRMSKETKELDETLLAKFLQTQNGYFTRPLNAGDRYISYKILSKQGTVTMSYEQAKGAVIGRWRQKQQTHALKDYFEKLRSNADIEKIR